MGLHDAATWRSWAFCKDGHASVARLGPQKSLYRNRFVPQIAIAIGVLTSNRKGRRRTTLADWTWHQGAIAGCIGRGAIAGCHCSVL